MSQKENLCQSPEYPAEMFAEYFESAKARALRTSAIETIIGDDYDLDRFRELVEADRDGRCVTLCKHDFVYDELHKKIVCQKCGYVLTAEDKRRICDKGLELLRAEESAEAALKGERDEKH